MQRRQYPRCWQQPAAIHARILAHFQNLQAHSAESAARNGVGNHHGNATAASARVDVPPGFSPSRKADNWNPCPRFCDAKAASPPARAALTRLVSHIERLSSILQQIATTCVIAWKSTELASDQPF